MAFTGTPVVKIVTDALVRVTGLSLVSGSEGPGASGTISLFAGAGDVKTPVDFQPKPYTRPDGTVESLQDSVEVSIVWASHVDQNPPISIIKTGTTSTDFLITLMNEQTISFQESPQFELYIRFH